MKEEIIIAGFGGQGVLSMGKILAYSGLMENKEVTFAMRIFDHDVDISYSTREPANIRDHMASLPDFTCCKSSTPMWTLI